MHYLSDVPTRGYNSYDWPPASPRGAPPSREAPWSPTQGDMSHHPYPAAPSVDSRASLHISSGGSPHQPPRLLTPPNSGNGPPAPFTPTSAGFSNPGNAYPPPYVNSRSVSPAPRSPRRSAVSNNVYPPPRPGPMNAPSSPAQYSYDTKSTEYQMGSVPVDAMRGVMSDLRRTVMESAASTASVGQPSSPSVNVAGGGTYGNSYENPSQQHAGYSAPSPNLPPHVLHGHPSARHLTHPARPILPSSGRTSQQGPLNVNSSAYSRTPFASSSASQQGPLHHASSMQHLTHSAPSCAPPSPRDSLQSPLHQTSSAHHLSHHATPFPRSPSRSSQESELTFRVAGKAKQWKESMMLGGAA